MDLNIKSTNDAIVALEEKDGANLLSDFEFTFFFSLELQ